MNPTQTPQKPNVVSAENLLEKAFENNSFSQPPAIDEEDLVTHTEDHRAEIKSSWAEFYAMRSETVEGPAAKAEVQQMVVEQVFEPHVVENSEGVFDTKPIHVIEEQKGSGSAWAESGLKILPDYKDVGRSLFGALNIFREIFMDTFKVVKTGFKVEKAVDPKKAKEDAEKKADKKRKAGNISAFISAMQAQVSSVIVSVDAARMDVQEKENINKTVKLNTSYKGIKDSFGRLTVYAASMFEREQLDEEKKMKKIEKEQKMATVAKGPDLNLDKVAEGGFLSSTGGQGAG